MQLCDQFLSANISPITHSHLQVFDRLMNGDIYPYPTYFYNVTGVTDYYNILRTSEPEEYNYYVPYVTMDTTRAAIHVGNLSYGANAEEVELHLANVCGC